MLDASLQAPPPTVRRGIAPQLLLSQVENTAPFLFEAGFGEECAQPHVSLLRSLRRREKAIEGHADYFRFCLAAHHATVASFVPTDVDNAIRSKLWDGALPVEILEKMAFVVEESFSWSGRGLSSRHVAHEEGGPALSGLLGEWYSTAAAAYGSLRRRSPKNAERILAAIESEVEREERVFLRFEECGDKRRLLETATILAHNLGDLDRVIDQWELPDGDPLRAFYKRGGVSARAGAWNRAHMAAENHRHLALRKPRSLRRRSEWLLPIGPFFDDWGMKIARGLSADEVGEVTEALVDGWHKIPETVGYPRALAGILEAFPGGGSALRRTVPARIFRALESGRLRTLIGVPRVRFEASWSNLKLGPLS